MVVRFNKIAELMDSVIHREPGLKRLIFNKLRFLLKMVRVFPPRRARGLRNPALPDSE